MFGTMGLKLRILERDEKSITLEVEGLDLGFSYAIVRELLADKRVLNAWSKKDHPLEPALKIYILTDGTIEPAIALKEALSRIKGQLEELKDVFSKEVLSKR